MIRVLIPANSEFQKYDDELKSLYQENQKKICDTNSYEFVRDNTLFYAFLENNILFGAIYYFVDDGKLFLNAFSKRKRQTQNINALSLSMTWFLCDIYAEAQNRASAFTLLRCGFKRTKGNLFKYTRI